MAQLADLLIGLKGDTRSRAAFLRGTRAVSYGALRDNIGRARGLLHRLGVLAGARVAVASADEEAASILYGACLTSGAATVMIDPLASAAEANVLLNAAKPSAVFADRSFVERAQGLQRDDTVPIVCIDRQQKSNRSAFGLIIRKSGGGPDSFPRMLQNENPRRESHAIDEDATALILFTSGTTSRPKGVELSYGNLAAQMQTFQTYFDLDANCRIVNHLPLHHSDGLNQGPLLAIACGGTWVRPASVKLQTIGSMLDLAYQERATHLITVPTVLAMAENLPRAYDDSFAYPEFRFIESTAGYLGEDLWRRIEDRFGVLIVNCYGLTETVCEALYCGPAEDCRKHGTIGKPVGCEARILDEQGNEVPPGEEGELTLRGANIMKGYFEDVAATQAVFRDGWLMTGDLAAVDSDGFFRIVGRKQNVVIRGGFNIYPEDVNVVLAAHEAIAEAATIGMPDKVLGERVICCVVPGEGHASLDTDEVYAHLRIALGAERLPNSILILDALPYGPSGKVELAKLRAVVEKHEAASQHADLSDKSAEQSVFDVAASVFHVRASTLSISSTDDTTPGWNSLSFLELIMAIERKLNIRLEPRDVMNIRSLADIIDIVGRKTDAKQVPAL